MAEFFFYVLSAVTLIAAALSVLLRNLYHCALFLAIALFGVAGVFLYLGSEFLAVVQVLIYVGAVTVILIFGIMLTRNVMEARQRVFHRQAFLAALVGLALTAFAVQAVRESDFLRNSPPSAQATLHPAGASEAPAGVRSDVYLLGPELLDPKKGFVFAFELVSILLLSALVGAIVVARQEGA